MSGLVDFPPHTWLQGLQALFALAIGHALADFPLQGEFLAMCKNRRHLIRLKDANLPPSMWISCMAAHCLIHAGMVWIVTGSALLGAVELVIHWALDVAKCEGKTDFSVDQCLHVVCKIMYVIAGMAHLVG
ncbi:MAG: DUF3307 domain-containing protein [Verrucomicrobiaceae bacterium]|nr:DUF3307 domain-containing protein [Verrucomicrobiaceae bacterium]